MNDININAALDFTLEHDDILIYVMFNDKNNIASKTLEFTVAKRYDKELPILKRITDASDICTALKQFGFSEEEIESFMLVKKYGIANPNNINMQLKFTEYKKIISDIQVCNKNKKLFVEYKEHRKYKPTHLNKARFKVKNLEFTLA